jgi:molybdenum cofactor cytidylyltransferase
MISMTEKTTSRVGAVILAAGGSTRMGEAKQLLRLGDSTVLEQTIENVRGAGIDEIVLVLGSSAEKIRQRLPIAAVDGLKVVVNQHYSQGMASSIQAGLSALGPNPDAALIVLGDQPFVRSETFDRIVDWYRSSNAKIVIPLYKGFRGNPVLLDSSVFSEVMALEGDIGCRAIFGRHSEGIFRVDVDDVGILLDIDTKEDYERLRRFDRSAPEGDALIKPAAGNARAVTGVGKSESEPTPQGDELLIVGWGPVASALVKLGQLLNLTVTVVDPLLQVSDLPPGPRLLNTLDFSLLPPISHRYVVVASRGKFDEEAIEQALRMQSSYVGLMASKKRGQEMRRNLEQKGEPAEKLAALRVPAGIDIGAKTPEEIALSIMAEIVLQRQDQRQK